mmetsp:Transcript_58311/g.136486  ORF Transcript_58311/g.136486 Transcript_58311/m.136486 type:complete len:230 (+) Transcript_58311:930-1619(+)
MATRLVSGTPVGCVLRTQGDKAGEDSKAPLLCAPPGGSDSESQTVLAEDVGSHAAARPFVGLCMVLRPEQPHLPRPEWRCRRLRGGHLFCCHGFDERRLRRYCSHRIRSAVVLHRGHAGLVAFLGGPRRLRRSVSPHRLRRRGGKIRLASIGVHAKAEGAFRFAEACGARFASKVPTGAEPFCGSEDIVQSVAVQPAGARFRVTPIGGYGFPCFPGSPRRFCEPAGISI